MNNTMQQYYEQMRRNQVYAAYMRQFKGVGCGDDTPPVPPTPKINITVNASPVGAGSVTGNGLYDVGSTATLSATPNEDYNFTEWDDENRDNPRTLDIVVGMKMDYTAQFALKQFTITTKVSPEGAGTVTDGRTYEKGTSVTLTATPNSGYAFTKWNDDVTENPRTIIVTKDEEFTAIFEQQTVQTKIKNESTGTLYDTFNQALTDATDGDTLKLVGTTDFEVNSVCELDKDLTIDLNGLSIVEKFTAPAETTNKRGMIYTTTSNLDKELTVKNGTFVYDRSQTTDFSFIRVNNDTNTKLNITNVDFVVKNSGMNEGVCVLDLRGGVATITSCDIYSDGKQPIVIDGNRTTSASGYRISATFDHCNIVSENQALGIQNGGTVTINDSTLSSNLCACVNVLATGGRAILSNSTIDGGSFGWVAYCDYDTYTPKYRIMEPRDLIVFTNVSANGKIVQRFDGDTPPDPVYNFYSPYTINSGKFDNYDSIVYHATQPRMCKDYCNVMGIIYSGEFNINKDSAFTNINSNKSENSIVTPNVWDGVGTYTVTQN